MPKPIIVEIETVIRRMSRLTPQVGRKSLQTLSIDFGAREIAHTYSTGTTHVGFWELDSTRDNFFLNTKAWPGGTSVLFYVSGQTASGVKIMPNINYEFEIRLSLRPAIVSLNCRHDGFPSYNVAVNGSTVYDHVQQNIWQLMGDSDVVTAVENKPYRR